MNQSLLILKSLSDRNRLRVVAALMDHEELCACQLTELLQVTGATASRHMALLLNAGLVTSRKEGRWVHYKLSPTFPPHLFQWLEKELQTDIEHLTDQKRLTQITRCAPEEIARKQRSE